MFVASDGGHLSLREVYAAVRSTLRSQRTVYARLLERVDGPEAERFELASAR